MDEQKNCIFVARKEYMTILVYTLYPAIYQGLKSIWQDSKRVARPREVFSEFQTRLTRVRKWNQDVIENEYKRITEKTKCDYLEELIKRVFVLNTQILAAVNMAHIDPNKKIKVKVPKGEKFVHCCYRECARAFYENALLMEDRLNSISRVEQLRNLQKAYKLIMTCIENTVRNMLPIESLLKNSLDDDEGEDATPPATLFGGLHPQHQLPQQPMQPYLQSYPTVNNFLQQQQQNPVAEAAPSNNSLQPSMNDLGTVPLPDSNFASVRDIVENRDRQDAVPIKVFDPENLFDSTDGFTEKIRDKEQELSLEQKGPDNYDVVADAKVNERTDAREPVGKASSALSVLGNLFHPGPRIAHEVPDNNDDAHNTKTIFLGKSGQRRSSISSNRAANDSASQNSDASDNEMIPRKKDDPLDQDYNEFPVVRRDRTKEALDLDVFSATNELPIGKRNVDVDIVTTTNDVDSSKQSVPPIENTDKENFFSDVE